jgi:hypothetical protein
VHGCVSRAALHTEEVAATRARRTLKCPPISAKSCPHARGKQRRGQNHAEQEVDRARGGGGGEAHLARVSMRQGRRCAVRLRLRDHLGLGVWGQAGERRTCVVVLL